MKFTAAEKSVLFSLLDDLNHSYGNAGCNDFTLPPTPENRDLLREVIKNSYDDSSQIQQELKDLDFAFEAGQQLYSMDVLVLEYLSTRLSQVL